MNISSFILLVALVGLAISFALPAVRRFASRKGRALVTFLAFGTMPHVLANDGGLTVGVHQQGAINGYCSSAPQTTRFLLMKQGASDFTFAIPTSIADMPICVCIDEPAATTDVVSFRLLNSAGQTLRMVASGAIAAGAIVVTNGDGKIKSMPAVAGVYWGVGVAVTTAADGELVEVDPRLGQVGVSFVT